MEKRQELAAIDTTKGRRAMTHLPEPTPIPADFVPGPKQGSWTYGQYAALPEDGKRYEVIDGVLYLMPPAPKEWHQDAALLLATYLNLYIRFTGVGRVYIAPFDVELAFDTVVQPDVLIVLAEHKDKITPSRVIGAPDVAIEVLSPGTKRYDRIKKWRVYARAGVREYWLVDPGQQTIEVLVLEGETYNSLGVFSGEEQLRSTVIEHFPVQVKQIFGE